MDIDVSGLRVEVMKDREVKIKTTGTGAAFARSKYRSKLLKQVSHSTQLLKTPNVRILFFQWKA